MAGCTIAYTRTRTTYGGMGEVDVSTVRLCVGVGPEMHAYILWNFYSPGKLISKATGRVLFFIRCHRCSVAASIAYLLNRMQPNDAGIYTCKCLSSLCLRSSAVATYYVSTHTVAKYQMVQLPPIPCVCRMLGRVRVLSYKSGRNRTMWRVRQHLQLPANYSIQFRQFFRCRSSLFLANRMARTLRFVTNTYVDYLESRGRIEHSSFVTKLGGDVSMAMASMHHKSSDSRATWLRERETEKYKFRINIKMAAIRSTSTEHLKLNANRKCISFRSFQFLADILRRTEY